MSEQFPYCHFLWVHVNDTVVSDILNLNSNNSDRYIVEVDLNYPGENHDAIMIIL